MASNKDLELALKIKALFSGSKNITELSKEIERLGLTANKPIPDPTPEIRAGAEKTGDAVDKLTRRMVGLVSIAAIKQFVDNSTQEFARAEMAYRGLEAVANFTGVGIGRAMQEAEKLAADGLMSVAESSKALQNLLARGYNIDQAVQTLTRLKADTEEATDAVEKFKHIIDAIKDKTITLSVQQAGAVPGAIPGYATGTILPGYGGGDRRLILAEDGEAITRKEAVAYYGRSFMAQLNAMRIPRFQSGGIVSSVAAVSPGGSGLHPVTLNMPGVGAFQMSAKPDVVDQLKAAISREALMRGRRH